ncbi:hypothetical protein ACH79_39870 [Bradyrhizobium sp. CCBAU 051011]|nr:hypothetical protein ACH79_39870 [Bradyrhizobium sp. CCBAU 051011]
MAAGQPASDIAVVVRPFLEARNAYFSQLNDQWQGAQRSFKESCCVHARTRESLVNELRQDLNHAANRYHENLRALSQAEADERRRAAASDFSRYLVDVDLAQLTAWQKWNERSQEVGNTIAQLRQSYAQRSKEEYRKYLGEVKRAWESVDITQVPAALLRYIVQLNEEVARHAWYSGGGR